MKLLKILSLFTALLSLNSQIFADEGMWMLPSIKKDLISDMKDCGCEMSADEIYSPDSTSLKDAVIVFGGGCTGVVVSEQGLIFTNHHCGYGAIQKLSSVEHNYLMDGYTAKTNSDELACAGLSVKFLHDITDVTERVKSCLSDTMSYKTRKELQDSVMKAIKTEFDSTKQYLVQVKSYYDDNEFFVLRYIEYKDIRLAFTPPHALGKFGGDTDNWMWPRHTADFSVFRVYTAPDGKPAEYAADNIPMASKRAAAVSLKGYKPGDFTMIMGNPGTTNRYLSSWGIEHRMKTGNTAKIEVRDVKQKIWKSFMKNDPAINIKYASKYARSSNYWKNSIGMNAAIEKLDVLGKKREQEENFRKWAAMTPERAEKYGPVLDNLKNNFSQIRETSKALQFLRESFFSGAEISDFANNFKRIYNDTISKDSLLKESAELYKDYDENVDKATMSALLKFYKESINSNYFPSIYKTIDKKFKGNIDEFVSNLYSKSIFNNKASLEKAIKSGKLKIEKDPAYVFYKSCNDQLNNIRSVGYEVHLDQILQAEHKYVEGLMEIQKEKGIVSYPDANFTMRLTYGKVGGYSPKDAVSFNYYSTTDGVLEKEIPGDMEFDVPAAIKENLVKNDLADYADENTGKLHAAFLSNNDITGGNSGSPIFNSKGELLGLAFDGNWEAMSGDIVFEPKLQRTINVDVRYILYIMDHVYGAERLVDELKLVVE